MKQKRLWIAVGIPLGFWVLTLGIFHKRSPASEFHVVSGEAWAAFEDGHEIFYPSTWIDGGNYRKIGIPYLFHSVTDRPPYGLSFCFTAKAEQQVNSITSESINIKYDDGQRATPVNRRNSKTSAFNLDDRGAKLGETPYLRANFSFSDCLSQRDSFWATVTGSYTKDEATVPYTTRIRVNIHDETYTYPGWMALFIRSL